MPDEGSASDVQYALDQLNQAPPAPSSADGMGQDPVTPQQPPPELWQENDGSRRFPELSVHAAAKELSFARRQRGEEADGTKPRPITEVRYQREPEGELTADQASKDLSAYRRETAERLLTELTGEAPAQPQPEATPAPQSEQPTFSPEQLEQAAQRQQAEAFTQHARQVSGDYDNLLVRQVQNELANIRQQQAAAYTEAFQKFAEAHDARTEKLIPELAPGADPKAKTLLRQASLDVLKEVGFDPREIEHAWSRGGQFMLRDARAQAIISMAAKYKISQQRAREAIRAPLPEVQRPGVRMPESSFSQQLIEGHSKALSGSGNLRDAVALRRAQYAQRRNG
jgi:hypothetical protein